jgi:hypothetical protein
MDPDVKAVLEFMQGGIRAPKLVSVADSLPAVARLLWGQYSQEACYPLLLELTKPEAGSQSQPAATGSPLGFGCVDGGSEEAAACQ